MTCIAGCVCARTPHPHTTTTTAATTANAHDPHVLSARAHHPCTRTQAPLGRVLPNLVSGGFLLLAVRAALGGAWWGWVSLCLLAALIGHLEDLRRAWR